MIQIELGHMDVIINNEFSTLHSGLQHTKWYNYT